MPWDTNDPPFGDIVNNVENIYIKDPLGTNYSVTVVGRRVNVNAVTAHPDNVVQDFALVISSGTGDLTNALTLVGKMGSLTRPAPPRMLSFRWAPSASHGESSRRSLVIGNPPVGRVNDLCGSPGIAHSSAHR